MDAFSVSAADGSTPETEGTVHGFVQAFAMIIFSEIGDKTFLIAAILAMRHPRIVVFAGAFGSLVVMSILSAAMGHILPTLIPKRWTQLAAGVLFIIFGAKLFFEGKDMPSGNEKVLEEMREAEEEINEDVAEHEGTGRTTANGDVIPLEEIEAGAAAPIGDHGDAREKGPTPPSASASASAMKGMLEGTRNLCSLLLGPVFVQVFVLTFLGEWGDRSQIATIMLAAAHNVYIVALGTIIGHMICTAIAVIAGRYVSTRISAKHVTLGGAVLFLCFGVVYLYEAGQAADIDPQDHIPRG
jgi:putative Ca2+/H+ antiporter (TMEM165/GDT1 family)